MIFKNLLKGAVKSFTIKNIKATAKQIPKGTFNYFKYKRENTNMKTITSYDHVFEYCAQLPYLKLVTYPIGISIYTVGIVGLVGYVYCIDYIDSKK